MTVNVWAEAKDVPGKVCSDARLGGHGSSHEYPSGTPRGQAGWHLGIPFEDPADLAKNLANVRSKSGQIGRLAIHAHGDANGVVYLEGQREKTKALTPDNLPEKGQFIQAILNNTAPDATILFMGCIAGLGYGGTQLVTRLSTAWPGRTVVAFTTIGYTDAVLQERDHCNEPGMRDTGQDSPTVPQALHTPAYVKKWNDLEAMPWQSEKSRSAKVALNGQLRKGSTDEGSKTNELAWFLDKELADAWIAYAKARVMGSQAYDLFSRFKRLQSHPARRNIKYIGAYGPNADRPPWDYPEEAFDDTPRAPAPTRRGTGKPPGHR